MNIGFVTGGHPGDSDRVLNAVAARLGASGRRVIGAVQLPSATGGCESDMDLCLIPSGEVIRISQNLGRGSEGCRLDPGGLEAAVAAVEQRMHPRPDMLVVSKFGRAEAEGRGFRPLIAEALSQGVPVLTGVGLTYRPAFDRFTEGHGHPLPTDAETVLRWCFARLSAIGQGA